MPKYTLIQNSFSAGEISPKLESRTDIKEYANGLETMKNMLPYKTGGGVRRPGLRLLQGINSAFSFTNSVDNAKSIMEIPFEFGEGKRFKVFLRSEAALGSISILDQSNTVVAEGVDKFTTAEAVLQLDKGLDVAGFHYAQMKKSLFITHNSGDFQPIHISYEKDMSQLAKDGVFHIDTLGNKLQNGAIGNYNPVDPNSDFQVAEISQVPMLRANPSTNTMIVHAGAIALGNTVTLRYKDSAGTGQPFFTTEDIGTFILLDDASASPGRFLGCVVTAFTAPTSDADAVIVNLSAGFVNADTDFWYESAWSDKKGWPKSVASFESRIMFGGTKSFPDTVWASQVNLPTQLNSLLIFKDSLTVEYSRTPDGFTTIPLQLQPYNFNISSQSSSSITWLSSGRALLIGTETTEYAATGGDNSIMTPLVGAIQVKPQSFHGSTSKMPAVSNNKVYYISRDGQSVMEFGYSSENGSYISRDISMLSDEIMYRDQPERDSRIRKLVWNESRSILWVLTNKFKLYGVSVNKASGLLAWHSHSVDNFKIYDIASVTNADDTFIDTHAIALADDSAATGSGFICHIPDNYEHASLFNTSTRVEDKPVFLDHGQYLAVAPASATIDLVALLNAQYGMNLFQGDLDDLSFSVMYKNGAGHKIDTAVVPAAGVITLSQSTDELVFGFPYQSKLRSLVLETGPSILLNSQGDQVRYDRATFLLYKTRAGEYGIDETQDKFEIASNTSYTGKARVDMPGNYTNDARITVQTSEPLPMSVLGIIIRGVNNP